MHGTTSIPPGSFAAALKGIRDAQAQEEERLRDQHARNLEALHEAHRRELSNLAAAHAAQLDAFFENMQLATNQVQVESNALYEKKRQWDLVEQRVQDAVEKLSHSVIKLNVGGRLFAIPKDTLLKYEGSYFHAMLSHSHWKPDLDNDAYFIDADPTLFEYVMAYLREGDLSCEGLPPLKKQRLMKTLDYLNLEVLEWDASASVGITDGTILISEDKRTVSFALTIADESGFIQANRPVDRVSIQLVSRGNSLNEIPLTYIGLEAFKPDGDVDSVVSYNICSGDVSRGNNCEETPRGQTFANGDILTIAYNRQTRSITFAKNGLDMGICLEDVPDKKYYPYVDTNCDGICLSLAS
ncbi:Aste57867_23001 [Aphanomyces stellatus]|uniref:Aste57867_23001 protein n=1 Tax=Aphanomyces stellatus TaxID=120398 RepID=A0A485LR77_9STRA|nr:hypothetical protein As57867_022930 [Aphanomyces stellatus]VFT99650.1 Aste57867_23001 [Aphanomyces stellatus]